ncbi:MAG: SBBP repeat-containing protein [Candidatus Moraniibacteriota bacterium]|nr:MAG: SBBP repeat-containing protein [Candidatus Moranbacteria bacterium]
MILQEIYITGYSTGDVDLNGDGDFTDLYESGTGFGGLDAFISTFTSEGTHLWTKRLGGTGTDWIRGTTLDSSGNIYSTGYVTGDADLNGDGDFTDPYESGTGFGLADIFLSAFSYDTTPPSLTLTPISTPTSDTTFTITGTTTDTLSDIYQVHYQIDSTEGEWIPCTPDDSLFDSPSESFSCPEQTFQEGTHTIYIKATDNALLQNETLQSLTFTIDLTYPSLT